MRFHCRRGQARHAVEIWQWYASAMQVRQMASTWEVCATAVLHTASMCLRHRGQELPGRYPASHCSAVAVQKRPHCKRPLHLKQLIPSLLPFIAIIAIIAA